MPVVKVEEHIAAPIETAWELVNDVTAYPRLMEPVRSVEVLEAGKDYRRVAWEVDLKGCVMRWVEYEAIDQARHRIDYHQVDGDLGDFRGYWELDGVGDGTRVVLLVDFDIGMPTLSEMLDPVAVQAVEQNSRAMLASLASAAAATVG